MFAAYIFPAIPQIALHISPLLVSFAMISRGSSINVTSGPAFPLPIGGPSSGGPPSVATDRQPFHADAAGTLETGLPQSETSSRAIPPLSPPWPTPFPHPPRGVSGLRWESARQNTYDTYPPSPEEYAPMQYPKPAPGGGVGGFTPPPPFNRDAGRVHSYRNTANYAYRFDAIPTARSDSDPVHYQSEDITGGVHAEVWPIYNKISEEHDKKMLKELSSELDSLPTFVSVAFGPNR